MYDVVIVGGGIAGLGIAQAAARRGLSPLVLERNDFAAHTSNNSLRIIHGGFRYLQSFDIPRVLMSRRAQARIMRSYPELVRPLRCIMPLKKHGLKSKYPAMLGCLLYRALSLVSPNPLLPQSRVVASKSLVSSLPIASDQVLEWWDAVMLDQKVFANAIRDDAEGHGAQVIAEAEFESAQCRKDSVAVFYKTSDGVQEVAGKYFVNATGPWIETLRSRIEMDDASEIRFPKFTWCRAFNVVFKTCIDSNYALGFQSAQGSLFFLCPRGEGSALGTGYLPHNHPAPTSAVSEEEVVQFLERANESCPGLELSLDDVDHVESGVLPVRSIHECNPVFYGSDELFQSRRYLEVLSTKYTSFQVLGNRVVEMFERS